MGKYSSTLDQTDVIAMMRALGALHSGVVTLTFLPLGTGSSGSVEVVAMIHFDVLPGSHLPSEVVAKSYWPCKTCKSFWGHVYNGLYTLDQEISRVYQQEALWKDGQETPKE